MPPVGLAYKDVRSAQQKGLVTLPYQSNEMPMQRSFKICNTSEAVPHQLSHLYINLISLYS
jgi:hypothetical protein